MASTLLENTGSTARDFCMLERNILSHLKLALLLSLLSSSALLRTRLVPNDGSESPPTHTSSSLPMATILFVASIAAIVAGCWQYQSGYRDLRNMKAFLVSTKPHLAIMSVVAGVVISTCIILLSEENDL